MALSAIVNYKRADLYHLRLIYDTVSLVGYEALSFGVSSAALILIVQHHG